MPQGASPAGGQARAKLYREGCQVMATPNPVFLVEGDVTIYHAYKETGRCLVYHYSIDPNQRRTFDVRDLPCEGRLQSLEDISATIRTAIQLGIITQDHLHV